jgi:hypothetical protein
MQDPECELRRIPLLGNSVNKDKKRKGGGLQRSPRSRNLMGKDGSLPYKPPA